MFYGKIHNCKWLSVSELGWVVLCSKVRMCAGLGENLKYGDL